MMLIFVLNTISVKYHKNGKALAPSLLFYFFWDLSFNFGKLLSYLEKYIEAQILS